MVLARWTKRYATMDEPTSRVRAESVVVQREHTARRLMHVLGFILAALLVIATALFVAVSWDEAGPSVVTDHQAACRAQDKTPTERQRMGCK